MQSDRIRFINHNGKQILYVNFTGIDLDEVAEVLDAAKAIIAQQPPKSVRHLTDVTNTNFTKDIIRQFKMYAAHNAPYIHRSAAVGVTGIMVVLFNAVLKFSGRKNIVLKNTLEEAKEWLCEGDEFEQPISPDHREEKQPETSAFR